MTQQKHLENLTYRLHKQRLMLAPSVELRNRYLTSTFQTQVKNERDLIRNSIGKLHPGVHRVFLVQRLKELNKRIK